MYSFIDTNEASEGANLPSEALKINNEYIEDQIPGYRTLNVSGREALSPKLTTYETGVRDGSMLKSRKFPERTIIVTYQLAAESNEAFREAYNKLGAILNVENAELIFADEPDKFFIGTPSAIRDIEPGMNTVVGEIEFLCSDPFKYSVIEYEAEPSLDESSVLIDYNGTYRAYPILEADFYNESEVAEDGETAGTLTGNGDCGYVAFYNEDKKIIQIGDPEEVDGTEEYEKSQTLINQVFSSSTAWGTAAQALWSENAGIVLPDDVQQVGSVGIAVASYAVPANPASTSGTILKAVSRTDVPVFNYTVSAKTSGRTANSVNVTFTITASLALDSNYFGRGYILDAGIYVSGSWRTVRLKNSTDYWRGRTGHTVNLSVTVSGLSSTASAISGIKFRVNRPDPYQSEGMAGYLPETACSNLAISPYTASVAETYFLNASNYGTSEGKWHGPSISRSIGADASGEVGASDFTLTYKQKMCIGNSTSAGNQMGGFQVNLSSADGTVIAGVRVLKNKGGNTATLMLIVNGAIVHQTTIDLSYNNKYFGAPDSSVKTSNITKSGEKVSFIIGGYNQVFNDDSIASTKVTKVTFMFEQYSSVAALAYNGLYWAKLVKNNCNTIKDIPNKFSANDVLEADCKNGEIYLNGVLSPDLGALGNDWESFYLTPGLNQIGIAYSEWLTSEYAPSIKIRYREVFL